MSRPALLIALPATLLAALVLAPFLDKPFTIDDPVFLLQARHALADPLHPSAFDMVWDDSYDRGVPARAASISGPVMAWLLVPAVLAGGAEWVGHLVQLAFLAVALGATAALARRLGVPPRWSAAACVLVATAPGVLGMAGTVMPDVPAMALGVAGVERLVAWRQERRAHQAVLAAALLGLATLTRSHLALLLAVGALLLVGDFLDGAAWRRVRWTAGLPLAAAALLAAAVVLVTRDPAPGAGAFLAVPPQLRMPGRIPRNAVAFATHWATAFPLVLTWLLLRWREVLRRWWILAPAAIAAAAALRAGGATRLPVAIVAAVGVGVLVDVAVDGWRRRDAVQVALLLWLLVPLAPTAYVHLPPKYLLAAAPAAAILIAREMARRGGRLPRVVLGTTAALGLVLGIAILRADAAFAGVARRAARELIAPGVAAGRTVWFVGSWGFHWYAVEAGARPVTASPPYPSAGDLVVVSRRSAPSAAALAVLERLHRRLVGALEARGPGGRAMSREAGAGFYSNGAGYLPWGWGDGVLDRFELWRIDGPITPAP